MAQSDIDLRALKRCGGCEWWTELRQLPNAETRTGRCECFPQTVTKSAHDRCSRYAPRTEGV